MLYIIGLTLAFIFGYLYGRDAERRKIDNATPIDLKLAKQDLFGPDIPSPDKQESSSLDVPVTPMKHLIFYNYGGHNN